MGKGRTKDACNIARSSPGWIQCGEANIKWQHPASHTTVHLPISGTKRQTLSHSIPRQANSPVDCPGQRGPIQSKPKLACSPLQASLDIEAFRPSRAGAAPFCCRMSPAPRARSLPHIGCPLEQMPGDAESRMPTSCTGRRSPEMPSGWIACVLVTMAVH